MSGRAQNIMVIGEGHGFLFTDHIGCFIAETGVLFLGDGIQYTDAQTFVFAR